MNAPGLAPGTCRATRHGQAVGDLCRIAGVQGVTVKEYPDPLIQAMGLFNPMLRELPEVAYQLKEPFVLDSLAAQRTFAIAPTPWDDALRGVVAAYR